MVLSMLKHVVHGHPFKFGVGFSCFKTAFSDWLVQSQVEKREHIDWRRNGTFAFFGAVYLGGVQYAIYVPLFTRLFPSAAGYSALPIASKLKDVTGTRNLVSQVILDQFVHHPLMYFPAFYMLKEAVNGTGSLGEKCSTGLEKYGRNYKEDLVALWKLWVPSTIINFAFMPMALRIPWVASTSLIWTCIISAMRGSTDVETDPAKAMDIAGGNQGSALSAIYDLGVAAKPDYLYDTSKSHLLLTASGRDRIGFLCALSRLSEEHGGNVLDMKAYKVGREFVTIMLIEADPAQVGKLVKDVTVLARREPPIHVNVQETRPWLSETDSPRCNNGVQFTGHLRATGPDTHGVILKITELLAEHDLDITSLSCNQRVQIQLSVDEEGKNELQNFFQMSGVVRAFVPVDRTALEARLVVFERESGCRLGITETEPDTSYSAFRSTNLGVAATASSVATRLARTISSGK